MSWPAPLNPKVIELALDNTPALLTNASDQLDLLVKSQNSCVNEYTLYDTLTITNLSSNYPSLLSDFYYQAKTTYGVCKVAGSVNPYNLPDGTLYVHRIIDYNASPVTNNDQHRKYDYITLENEFWNLETNLNPLVTGYVANTCVNTTINSITATFNFALPAQVQVGMMILIPASPTGTYRQIASISAGRTQITFDRPFTSSFLCVSFDIRDNLVNNTYAIDFETFLYRLQTFIRPLALNNNLYPVEAYISRRLTQDQFMRLIPHLDRILIETEYDQYNYPLYNDSGQFYTIRNALDGCSQTRTGTVSINNGTNLLVGTGTNFFNDLGVGTKINVNGNIFTISSFNSTLQQATTVELASSTITNATFTSYFNYTPLFFISTGVYSYPQRRSWMTSVTKSYVDVYRFHTQTGYFMGVNNQSANNIPKAFNDETNANIIGAATAVGLTIFQRSGFQSLSPVAPSPIPCPSCTGETIHCEVTGETFSNCLVAVSTNPDCDCLCNGTISGYTSYGTPPFIYQVTGSTTSVTYTSSTGYFTGLCADIYTLCVTDFTNLTSCYYLPITLSNSFYANIRSFLNGFCITISGGTLPYRILQDGNPLVWNDTNGTGITTNCYSANCNTQSVITVIDSSQSSVNLCL